jgi:hypothetical protein
MKQIITESFAYDRNEVLMLGYKDIKFKEPILKGYFEAHKWDILRAYVTEDKLHKYRTHYEENPSELVNDFKDGIYTFYTPSISGCCIETLTTEFIETADCSEPVPINSEHFENLELKAYLDKKHSINNYVNN